MGSCRRRRLSRHSYRRLWSQTPPARCSRRRTNLREPSSPFSSFAKATNWQGLSARPRLPRLIEHRPGDGVDAGQGADHVMGFARHLMEIRSQPTERKNSAIGRVSRTFSSTSETARRSAAWVATAAQRASSIFIQTRTLRLGGRPTHAEPCLQCRLESAYSASLEHPGKRPLPPALPWFPCAADRTPNYPANKK